MKKTFCLLLASLSFCLGSDFCAYDANGTCVTVLHNMQEAHLFFTRKGSQILHSHKRKTSYRKAVLSITKADKIQWQ